MIPLKLTRAHSPTKDTGRIFSWLVSEGAEVRSGQPVVEIELGRVTMELEAPGGGVIHIVAERGSTVPIGATLAEIRTPAEVAAAAPSTARGPAVAEAEEEPPPEEEPAAPEPVAEAAAEPEPPVEAPAAAAEEPPEPEPEQPEPAAEPEPEPVAAQPPPPPPAPTPAREEPLATPAARRLATELGVDLAEVNGTGPDGRILAEDVEKVAASRPATQVISALETQGEVATPIEEQAEAEPAAAEPEFTPPTPEPALAQPEPPTAPPVPPPVPASAPTPEAMPAATAPSAEPTVPPAPAPVPEPVAAAEPEAAEPEAAEPEPAEPEPAEPERAEAAPPVEVLAAPEAPAPAPAAARGGFYIHMGGELAADGLVEAHRTATRKFEGRTTVTDLLIMVVARALTDVPELNGTIGDDGAIERSPAVHLALADASERAEEAPVLHNAPSLKPEEIAAERQRLAEAAQRKQLTDEDLAGATSTFSNLGGYPLDFYVPSGPGAQIALITTGRVMEKPISFQRMLTIRPRMWVSVALDARGADAETGGRFLAALQKRLNDLPNTV